MPLLFLPWKQKQARKARFQQVMELARAIIAIDPHGLGSLIRLISAPLQARMITSAAHAKPHGARRAGDSFSALFFGAGLPITRDGQQSYELAPRSSDQRYRLRLGADPVLPTPWHRERLANALATIGSGKSQGAWSEDSNHAVTLVLPLGIGIVGGGNHSIAAGIVNGEGYITSTDVQDVAPLYAHVQYDGCVFVRSCDNAVLSRPDDEELGMLFEIGRLMVEHGVSPYVERVDPDAASDPSLSGGDGYYQVRINGQDAGVALTSSGATFALRQAGLQEGSVEWRQILCGEAPFVRRNHKGSEEMIHLRWRVRRRVINDLRFVYDVMPWVEDDDD